MIVKHKPGKLSLTLERTDEVFMASRLVSRKKEKLGAGATDETLQKLAVKIFQLCDDVTKSEIHEDRRTFSDEEAHLIGRLLTDCASNVDNSDNVWPSAMASYMLSSLDGRPDVLFDTPCCPTSDTISTAHFEAGEDPTMPAIMIFAAA